MLRTIFPILILWLLTYARANAQITFRLDIPASQNTSQKSKLRLYKYSKGAMKSIDTLTFNSRQGLEQRVELGSQHQPGLYLLSIDGSHFFEIILNKKETPLVNGTIKDFENRQVRIKESPENQAYYEYLAVSKKMDERSAKLQDHRQAIKKIDPTYYSRLQQLEQKLFNLQADYNDDLETIQQSYPATYTARTIIPTAKTPEPDKKQRQYYETNESFLHDHYLSTINFTKEENIRNYMLTNRLEVYLDTYIPAEVIYQKAAVDAILQRAISSSEMHQFITQYLMNYYFKNRREELVLYVYDQFQANKCSSGDSLQMEELIANLRENKKGKKVKELKLPNVKGDEISLKNTVNKHQLTLLLFWSATCESCLQEIPSLKRIYQEYQEKGLEVYAVNLDKNKSKWAEVIEQQNLNWVNLTTSQQEDRSQVAEQYGLMQTPALYVIGNNTHIFSKNQFGMELRVMVHNHLSQR